MYLYYLHRVLFVFAECTNLWGYFKFHMCLACPAHIVIVLLLFFSYSSK